MKNKIIEYILISFCLLSNLLLFAQPGDTDGTPTDNLEGTDPAATIDSMLLLIVVVAVVFGFYFVKKSQQKAKKSIRLI
jgi:hypothetical protein